MPTLSAEFGYHPHPLDLASGPVTITTLTDLPQTVARVAGEDLVDREWIYCGPQLTGSFGSGVRERPYPSRVFALPRTHLLEHSSAAGPDHLNFHLWALSFLTGMRLTAEEAGFLDATPIRPGRLVDFVLLGDGLPGGTALAEEFWGRNARTPEQSRRWAAAVHALFLAQYPQALQFERFFHLYTALDACFAIMRPKGRVTHADRIEWMCMELGMPVPDWASASVGGPMKVAGIRNAAIHEALFMGAPLGFALHGEGTNQNLTLEMEALVCRLLVALLGGSDRSYLASPLNTRERHGLRL